MTDATLTTTHPDHRYPHCRYVVVVVDSTWREREIVHVETLDEARHEAFAVRSVFGHDVLIQVYDRVTDERFSVDQLSAWYREPEARRRLRDAGHVWHRRELPRD